MAEKAPKRAKLELPTTAAAAMAKERARAEKQKMLSDEELAAEKAKIIQEEERRELKKKRESLDITETRKEANEKFESLKEALQAHGISTKIPKRWVEAQRAYAEISADLANLSLIKDSKERASLEKKIRGNLAFLHGSATDSVYGSIRVRRLRQPREQGSEAELPMSAEDEEVLRFGENINNERLQELKTEKERLEKLSEKVAEGSLNTELYRLDRQISALQSRVREYQERLSDGLKPSEKPTSAEGRRVLKELVSQFPTTDESKGKEEVRPASTEPHPVAEAEQSVVRKMEAGDIGIEEKEKATILDSEHLFSDSTASPGSIFSEAPVHDIPTFLRESKQEEGLAAEQQRLHERVGSLVAPTPTSEPQTEGEDLLLTEEVPVQENEYVRTTRALPDRMRPYAVHEKYAEARAQADESSAELAAKEQTHIEKEADYVTQHGALGRGTRKLFGRERAAFKSTKEELNQARLARVEGLEKYLAARLEDRNPDFVDISKLGERYRRRFITSEVSKGMQEHNDALQITREETRRTKESTRMQKIGEWMLSQNQKLDAKLGKTGARVLRTLASATAGSGIALLLGPVSWGIAGSIWTTRAVRGLAGMAVGTTLGLGAGSVYEARATRRGEEAIAEEQGRAVRTIEDIERKQRTFDAYSPEAIASKKVWIEIGVAAVTGYGANMGTGGLLAHFFGTPTIPVETTAPKNVAPPAETQVPQQPEVAPSTPPANELPPAQIAPPAPPIEVPHSAIPNVDVKADTGFGTEEMAKRIAEQLQAQHLNPNDYAPGSDVRQLLEASPNPNDPNYIDNVVHRLAVAHGFYNPDAPEGTDPSIIVQPDAHMTLGSDGQLHLNNEVNAAAPASVIVPAPEAAPIEAPNPQISVPSATPEIHSINPTEQPGFMPPRGAIEIKAAPIGAFAPAAIGAAYVATGVESAAPIASAVVENSSPVSVTESGITVSTDAEGRNLVDGGSEKDKEAFALEQAKAHPGKPFMFIKKIRSGFLGLASRDSWFMAYAEPGRDAQIFETVNNRDWRAVNFGTSAATPAPVEGEQKRAA